MVPQYSHLKQLRWKNLPSALSRSITYTRLWQKKHTSLPPMLVGNSFLREPWGRATYRRVFNSGKAETSVKGKTRQLSLQMPNGERFCSEPAVWARGHSS